jgi:hypothetical protein
MGSLFKIFHFQILGVEGRCSLQNLSNRCVTETIWLYLVAVPSHPKLVVEFKMRPNSYKGT